MTCFILLSREIGGVEIDVVVCEDHQAEMEISEHPVEKGVKVSDHVWRTPYRVRISGVVDSDRAADAYEALLAVQAEAEPFDLVTGLKLYSDMLIKSLNPVRDATHSRVLSFDCQLQEVIVVDTQTTAGPGGSTASATASEGGIASQTRNRGQVQARRVAPTPAVTSAHPLDTFAW